MGDETDALSLVGFTLAATCKHVAASVNLALVLSNIYFHIYVLTKFNYGVHISAVWL